ncbi:MAG: hypothetical protein PHH26_03900 [Candidatus Thermoplasmatota archaeon]|nr:hypothetical protein [Candidatus Thermoplasmatota archaeon]
MQDSHAEAEIKKYLRSVEKNLRGVPSRRRKEIAKEIEEHIRQKIDDESDMAREKEAGKVAEMVLLEMGSPEKVARAYAPEMPKEHWALRHIGKVTALSGFAVFIIGIFLVLNQGIDAMSAPPEVVQDDISLAPTESVTASIHVSEVRSLIFILSMDGGSVNYEIQNPLGSTVQSGTASRDGGLEKTIVNPIEGTWVLKITGGLGTGTGIYANGDYQMTAIKKEMAQSVKAVSMGAVMIVVGIIVIIVGAFAGLVNSLRRR